LGSVLAVLVAGVADAAPAQKAALHVVGLAPLTVRGTHFDPYEHVRLTLTTTAAHVVRHAVASPAGAFRTVVTGTAVDRCSAFAIVVRRADGSTVVLKVRPMCLPA
jgi:hypothetical protein